MLRVVVLSALVLVVAVTAWLLFGRGAIGASPGAGQDPLDPMAAIARAGGGDVGAPAVSRREAVAGPRAAPTSVRVRVYTQRDDESPVAGAVVEFPSAAGGGAATATTDQHGEAVVDTVREGRVTACCGGLRGEGDLAELDWRLPAELHLVLRRDVTVRALVLDPEQRPVEGVAVVAEVTLAARGSRAARQCVRLGTSDAQGGVVLPHAQCRLPMPGFDVLDWELRLVAEVGARRVAVRNVDYAEVERGVPVRLTVPTSGTVEVQVVDVHEQPLAAMEVRLRSPALIGWDRSAAWDRDRHRHVFEGLPLDGRFQVEVAGGGGPETTTTRVVGSEFAGPTRRGEVVAVRVQAPLCRYRLRGSLCRSDGLVLRRGSGALVIADTGFRCELRTDDAGRFDLVWVLPSTVQPLAGLRFEPALDTRFVPDPIAIPGTFGPGDFDLGELRVAAPGAEALLAVVDVRCEGRAMAAGVDLSLRDGPTYRDRIVPHRQRLVGDCLELQGAQTNGPLWLFVHCADHHPPAAKAITPGQHVVVELTPAATLLVKVRGPRVPVEWGVRLVRPDGEDDEWASDSGDYRYWDALAPGRYTLQCVVEDRVFFAADDVVLDQGRNVWPADGSVLDLRDRLRAIYVGCRARDDDGRDQAVGAVVVPSGAQSAPADAGQRERIDCWLLLRDQPVDLLYAYRGFVPARLARPTADTRLRLQPCTRLRLGGTATRADGIEVHVVADGVQDPALRQVDDGNPHADFAVSDASDYRLAFPPGTVLELNVVREDRRGPRQRVVVGATSPQEVVLQ